MKKNLIIILFLYAIAVPNGDAHQLTVEQSAHRVLEFLQCNNIAPQLIKWHEKEIGLTLAEKRLGLYVFNVESGGFIITPSAEKALPILGYAKDGHYNRERIPDVLNALLDDYAYACLQASEAEPIERDPIAPLLKCRWGQGDPYNRMCPEVNGERCVTGCVATAIAQIMYYYGQPSSSRAIYGYRTTTHKIQMNKLDATEFDWAEMLKTYDSSASETSCDAVAKLMLYCGCAFSMDYSPRGSGADTTPVCDGVPYYFGYASNMKQVQRANYEDSTWEELIYEQLANGAPVLYSGQDQDGNGHAFVCDGYENGFFHINWGWSGYCDGWFRLSLLNPYSIIDGDEGYSTSQKAVINFMPEGWIADRVDPPVASAQLDKNHKHIFTMNGTKLNNIPFKGLYVIKEYGQARKIITK